MSVELEPVELGFKRAHIFHPHLTLLSANPPLTKGRPVYSRGLSSPSTL